jgi:hypothetical protein
LTRPNTFGRPMPKRYEVPKIDSPRAVGNAIMSLGMYTDDKLAILVVGKFARAYSLKPTTAERLLADERRRRGD